MRVILTLVWMLKHKSMPPIFYLPISAQPLTRYSIAYTDNPYIDPQADYFPLLEDQLTAGASLGQAMDPSWQSLSLPGDLSVIPPFSNVNYLE